MNEISRLLREVRALELVARRNVSSLLTGNYRTTIIGRGMEFHEARHYVAGDPARSIDWKITARLDEPYVRTFVEERQREIIIALDVSPSMHSGWQRLSKIEAAVEMAATLAVSASDAGDRLGWVTFADRAINVAPPRLGRKQLFKALDTFIRAIIEEPQPCEVSDPRVAFHTIQSLKIQRAVIFVISDFIDRDVPEDLNYIKRKHDVSLLHIYDPLEYAKNSDVRLVTHSPEGPRRPKPMHLGDLGSFEEMSSFLKSQAAKHRVAMQSFSTRQPIGPSLARFFHQRRVEYHR